MDQMSNYHHLRPEERAIIVLERLFINCMWEMIDRTRDVLGKILRIDNVAGDFFYFCTTN